jgi:hypothetical protein
VRLRLAARLKWGERFRRPSRQQLWIAFGYAAAAALYVAIGVYETDFLLSWLVGAMYLLIVAWAVPVVVRRIL